MTRVDELICYPIKGCAGTSMPDTMLTPAGLAHDRSFMVTDPDGVFRTQRTDPRLAVIHPEISTDGQRLLLHAPGVESLPVDVRVDTARRDVDLFGAPYQGIDQGEPVAAWLTEALGTPSRLVRVPPEHDRVTDGELAGTSGYADSSPLLVVSTASLDLLNERIAARRGAPLLMNRFRPNIVVTGWDEPHREDHARRIDIGDAELGFAKVAVRCVVTLVEQETGVRKGPEPLRTLADYRRNLAPGNGVAFGAKFSVVRPGKLAVGDEVLVTRWAP